MGYNASSYTQLTEETNQIHFSQAVLGARYSPGNSFQMTGSIPVVKNYLKSGDNYISKSGLGDIQLKATYFALNRNAECHKIKQLITLGFGLKLPTGTLSDDIALRNIQTGSGTFDYSVNASHVLRINKLGLMSDFMYTLNGTDRHDYKFGNQMNFNSKFFMWIHSGKYLQIIPSFTAGFRRNSQDILRGYYTGQSEGSALYTGAGLDLYYKNSGLILSHQIPVYNSINPHVIQLKPRFSISYIYFVK